MIYHFLELMKIIELLIMVYLMVKIKIPLMILTLLKKMMILNCLTHKVYSHNLINHNSNNNSNNNLKIENPIFKTLEKQGNLMVHNLTFEYPYFVFRLIYII